MIRTYLSTCILEPSRSDFDYPVVISLTRCECMMTNFGILWRSKQVTSRLSPSSSLCSTQETVEYFKVLFGLRMVVAIVLGVL